LREVQEAVDLERRIHAQELLGERSWVSRSFDSIPWASDVSSSSSSRSHSLSSPTLSRQSVLEISLASEQGEEEESADVESDAMWDADWSAVFVDGTSINSVDSTVLSDIDSLAMMAPRHASQTSPGVGRHPKMEVCRVDNLIHSEAPLKMASVLELPSACDRPDLCSSKQPQVPVARSCQFFEIDSLPSRSCSPVAGHRVPRDRLPDIDMPELLRLAEWVEDQLIRACAVPVPDAVELEASKFAWDGERTESCSIVAPEACFHQLPEVQKHWAPSGNDGRKIVTKLAGTSPQMLQGPAATLLIGITASYDVAVQAGGA